MGTAGSLPSASLRISATSPGLRLLSPWTLRRDSRLVARGSPISHLMVTAFGR